MTDEPFGKGHIVTCHDCGAQFVLHVDQHTSFDCIHNLRARVEAAAHMLAAGANAAMGDGDLRFWAMGADAMARQIMERLGPPPKPLRGLRLIPPAPVSHGEVACDHPCPEYLDGEDCRCTLVNGGRPDPEAV